MKIVVFTSGLALAGALLAQQQPPQLDRPAGGYLEGVPQPGAPWNKPAGKPLPPAKVVAHVNQEAITAGKLTELLTGAPTLALNSAGSDPAEFLTWTYLLGKMSAEAEKQGLAAKSPYADRLAWSRAQVLMMARIEDKNREATPDEKGFEAAYKENPHRYGFAKTKLIFVPAAPGKEAAAKATMDRVVALARKGADFVELVKNYSADQETAAKDGDFPDITPDSKIPEPIRKAIFTTKVGDITPVQSQPAGLYLFKVVSINMRPLEDVSREARALTGQQVAGEWMAAEKKKSTVKIVHEAFFKALPATAGGVVSGRQKDINLQASPQTAEIKPTTLLAELNGRPVTAEDYTNLIKSLSPQVRTRAILSPADFLKDYAFMLHLVEDAERLGLEKRQPFRNRLAYDRNMTLMQAGVDEYLNNIVVLPEEQKKAYEADANRHRFAHVRVLYVAYSLTPPPQTDPNAKKVLNEAEALAKAESIVKEYREAKSADFAGFAMRYSDDEASRSEGGIMRPINFSDPQVPDHIRQPIFNAKAGDLVGPIKMPNGYYLFKVDSIQARKYEEVKDQIYEELRQERFQNWFNQQRAAFKVVIDDLDGFRQTVSFAR